MRYLAAITLFASIGALANCAYSLDAGVIWVFAALAFLTFGLFAVMLRLTQHPDLRTETPPYWETAIGVTVACALGAFFRFWRIKEVPLSWPDEGMFFVRFATHQVDSGFTYLPYDMYFHTFYGYIIAGWMLLLGKWLLAYRLAAASVALAVIASCFYMNRRLFSVKAGWIAAALLASSHWFLWSSRSGWQKFLTPLFQCLFVLFLFEAMRTRKLRAILLVGVSFSLGMHAYWGFYVMPGVWAGYLAYLFVFHRDRYPNVISDGLRTAAAMTVCSLPILIFFLRNLEVFLYPLNKYDEQSSDFWGKIATNSEAFFWLLSGLPKAIEHASWAPFVSGLVALAALLGIFTALLRWRRSEAHALMLLLFFVNAAALQYAGANMQFLIGVLAPFFALAGLGAATLADAVIALHPRMLRIPAFVGTLAMVALVAREDYRQYFDLRFSNQHEDVSDTAMAIAPVARDASVHGTLYLPPTQPGKSFDEPVTRAGWIPTADFDFVSEIRTFDETFPLFPVRQLRRTSDDIEILYPAGPSAEFLIQRLRPLYPGLKVTSILYPFPQAIRRPEQIGERIHIPHLESARYRGLTRTAAGADSSVFSGYLLVERDGPYRFLVPDGTRMTIHDVPASNEPLLLEAGFHPISVSAPVTDEAPRIEMVQNRKQKGVPIGDRTVHLEGNLAAEVELGLASLGRYASFGFRRLPVSTLARSITISVPSSPETMLVLSAEDLLEVDVDGKILKSTELHRSFVDLALWFGEPVLLDHLGTVLKATDISGEPVSLPCPARTLATSGNDALIFCSDGTLQYGRKGEKFSRVMLPHAELLLGAVRIALLNGKFAILDNVASRLITGNIGEFDAARVRLLPRLSPLWSKVSIDDEGVVYVSTWGGGMRAYDREGYLLFNRYFDTPHLFGGDSEPADPEGFNHFQPLHFNPTAARKWSPVLSARHGEIHPFQRYEIQEGVQAPIQK